MPTLQNIIAIMYDFDLTLSPHYMQRPLFQKYGIDEEKFWPQTREMQEKAAARGMNLDQEIAYLNLLLRHVRDGRFGKLSNAELRALGTEIELYPGLPDFFPLIKQTIEGNQKYKVHDITLEHYVISTGLKPMIEGSPVGEHLKSIFASELLEDEQGLVAEIARAIGYAKKTEFIHLINKGGNVNANIDVNGVLEPEKRRIPFENMIYVGDGPTDVPCFATLNRRGGTSIAVYDPAVPLRIDQAMQLRTDNRVVETGPGDYSPGSHLAIVLEHFVRRIADRIVHDREEELRVRTSPGLKL